MWRRRKEKEGSEQNLQLKKIVKSEGKGREGKRKDTGLDWKRYQGKGNKRKGKKGKGMEDKGRERKERKGKERKR